MNQSRRSDSGAKAPDTPPEWAAEIAVDEALARRLIGEQFPELELRSLSLLGQGWDMTVWLVDDEWCSASHAARW